MEMRRILQQILLGIGVLIVLGYSFFALKGYITGPQISLSGPETGTSTENPLLEIRGSAIHTTVLTINDTPTPLDLKGNFAQTVVLAPGYNIISIKAEDRYKRIFEKKLELTLIKKSLEQSPPLMATTTATSIQEAEAPLVELPIIE